MGSMYCSANCQPRAAVCYVGGLLDLRGVCVFPFAKSSLVECSLPPGSNHGFLVVDEIVVGVLDVLGGSRHARGFMLDRGLHSFRHLPLGRVIAAYCSFSTIRPRSVTAYGSLMIPEEPQGFAAYGYYRSPGTEANPCCGHRY